jgi:hypothetical protein
MRIFGVFGIAILLFLFRIYVGRKSVQAPSIKPIVVVDEWSPRWPSAEEWRQAGFSVWGNSNYEPILSADGKLQATRSHLQCPSGYELEFPGDTYESAICTRRQEGR